MFAFDTRDTKPKLTALWILTAAAALLIGILFLVDAERFAFAMCLTMAVYSLGAILVLLWAFREQIRYNPYSYNTIYYLGFAVFGLFVLGTYALLCVRMLRAPELYSHGEVLYVLFSSASNYMLLTFPFLCLFSLALVVSNIALIRREGKRLVNFLGIILAFLLVGGVVFLYVVNFSASGSQTEVMLHDMAVNLFAALFLYFECMLLGTAVANAIVARHEPEKDKDFLIVLGCRLRGDGTPAPLLKGRLDRALAFREAQLRETGKDLVFVTSGGQGEDEVLSESESMKRYLLEHGIPEEQILTEDQSRDTLQNMRFSKALIENKNPQAKTAFSTTNYHVFRSGLSARRVKMRAVGMGAKTKWYFWPNAAVREFLGLVTNHRGKQALILGTLIATYLLLTFLVYR